jgi:L-lactate dehydrogenase (cytochrome)
MRPGCVDDHRAAARRRMPRILFDYCDGGAMTETTLDQNVADFRSLKLRQRVMRDVGAPDTRLSLLGQDWSMPVALAPIGMAGYYARRGETQAARAARLAGVPFTLSTVSLCDLKETAAAAGTPPWFQLYILRDRGYLDALMQKARDLACPVLILTVDMPTAGRRWRDARNALGVPPSMEASLRRAADVLMHPAWLWDVQLKGGPHIFGNLAEAQPDARSLNDFWSWIGSSFDPTVTWKDLDWIRDRWPGTLLIKGIQEVEDAQAAISAGADGLIVSNHGGRNLDGARSSISALPRVVEAVQGRKPVLVDGGIRNGADILRALALGADACLIGRAWAWALGGGGQAGVEAVLASLKEELIVSMKLTGVTKLSEISRDLIDA